MERKVKSEAGQRGKYAEGKVSLHLAKLSTKYAEFDYSRIYDARSAGGRFPSRPGDFEFWAPKLHGLIEVKEVDHLCRLPSKNMKKEQIAKLRKRELAGGLILVLVYFTPLASWRSIPLNWLQVRCADPSWDLSAFPQLASAEECLEPLERSIRQA